MSTIELSDFQLSFSDEFDAISISSSIQSTATWYTHTPWNGDFGSASFKNSDTNGTFSIDSGNLNIALQKTDTGGWSSGLIASVDPNGQGYSQQYGYFEMRAELPSGDATWPAFWLVGMNRLQPNSAYTAEIDVMEQHGNTPDYFSSTTHIHMRDGSGFDDRHYTKVSVPEGSLSDGFHTYGVLIEADHTTFFLDGQSYWSVVTPEEYKQPMMLIADLGLGGGWSTAETPEGTSMSIDYIRAYSALSEANQRDAALIDRFEHVFDFSARETSVAVKAITVAESGATLVGSIGDDKMDGREVADRIQGHKGDDVIHGYGGNDYLIGDAGNDTIFGDAGNDQIYGGSGNDYLDGGDGNDFLNGGGGIDRLHGGEGADRYIVRARDKGAADFQDPDAPGLTFAQWVQIDGLDFGKGDTLALEGIVGISGAVGRDNIVGNQREFDALVASLNDDGDARTSADFDDAHDSLVMTLVDAAGSHHILEIMHSSAIA